KQCREEVTKENLYESLSKTGLELGPHFQGVEKILRRDGEAMGFLRPSSLQPSLLDACFQVLGAALPKENEKLSEGSVSLPMRIDQVRLFEPIPSEGSLQAHSVVTTGDSKTGNLQ